MSTEVQTKDENKLPKMLRILGGLALLSSGIAFLIQGIHAADSVMRINSFFFLMFAVLGTGVFCTKVIKENKGARSAMAAGLALLPFYFLQVSAVIYAQVVGVQDHGMLFTFHPVYDPINIGIMIVSILVLAFLNWLAFASLSKENSLQLATTFYAGNLVLLLPFRGSDYTSEMTVIIGTIMLLVLFYLEKNVFQKKVSLDTREAKFCRIMLFAPIFCLIGRNFLYSVDGFIIGFIFLVAALILGTLIAPMTDKFGTYYRIGSVFGTFSILSFYTEFMSRFSIAGDEILIVLGILLGAYHYYCAQKNPKFRKDHCRTAAMLYGLFVLIQFFGQTSTMISFVMLTSSIAVITLGWGMKHRFSVRTGILAFALAVLCHWHLAIELYQQNIWLSLGITGIIVVICSSLLEKKYSIYKAKLNAIKDQMDSWNNVQVEA